MSEFKIEAVGGKGDRKHPLPCTKKVREMLKKICSMCWDIQLDWTPSGEFSFRERVPGDPVFRVRDFERGGDSGGGLDLLGTYRHRGRDSLVTIYIDSCFKAARNFNVLLDHLVDVVLIHELAHLMTHRGFGVDDLSSGFMEHTAQCATYAYLRARGDEALQAFELLSPHQPFIYRTWESLKELPKPRIISRPDQVQEVVKEFFLAVKHTLRLSEKEDMHIETDYDE
jgi:hypothetical protein